MQYERDAVRHFGGSIGVQLLDDGARITIPAHGVTVDLDRAAALALACALVGRHGPLPGY